MRYLPARLPFAASAWLSAFLLLVASTAAAADGLEAFKVASGDAYRHYRGAVLYLRTGNLALAALELEEMAQKWDALLAEFAAAPPDAFADDPTWPETLTDVGRRAQGALAAIDAGQTDAATEALAPVRESLADLRRRNGVTFFSDYIDAVSTAMDALWQYRDAPPDFADAAPTATLLEHIAAMRAAVTAGQAAAPPSARDDPQFQRLMTGSLLSLQRIDSAVERKDPQLLNNSLGELKSFERILWMEFG
jgi:hypothetical protein